MLNISVNPSFAKTGERSQRAAIYNQYNEPIHVVSNIAVTDQFGEEEVLVNIVSAAVNPLDWGFHQGFLKDIPFMASATFPMIPGCDLSGKIAKVGSKVEKFKVGDEVYGMVESYVNGSFCEYYALSQDSIAKKPSILSWNEAAAIPATALTAYDGIVEKANIKAGQSILIIGGASAVGYFGIQIAKNLGASRIVTTCGTSNVDWVKQAGADLVIDYKTEDYMKILADEKFDIVFDAAGSPEDKVKSFDLVKPDGCFVTTKPNLQEPQGRPNTGAVRFITFILQWKKGYALEVLNKWIDAGKFKVKIDSVFPLDQTQEALDKCRSGKLSGKIIVEVTKL